MNAAEFLNSKLRNKKTNVNADGLAKFKLEGYPQSLTPQGLADLAKQQTGTVKVSLPKAEIAPDVFVSRNGTLSPTETSNLTLLASGIGIADETQEVPTPVIGEGDREAALKEALENGKPKKGAKAAK